MYFWLLFLLVGSKIQAQEDCHFIEMIRKYQDSVRLDQNQSPNKIDTSTFNLDEYLGFFSTLSTPTDQRCYYVYIDNFLDGYPILYVAKDSFDLNSYTENLVSNRKIRDEKKKDLLRAESILKFVSNPQRRAQNNMIPEDTKDGYLQYLMFNQMGEQFALKWHSNYDEKYVLCSRQKIYDFIEEHKNNEMFHCSEEELIRMNEIDPTPEVHLEDDFCIISWYEVETHNGVYKRTYKISREDPYVIDKTNEVRIVSIEISFLY